MIKCNVTVRGTVSVEGRNRNNHEGRPFFTVSLDVVIPADNGINKTVKVNVVKDGFVPLFDAPTKGSRVEISGTLLIRRRNNEFVFQIQADDWKLDGVAADDAVSGTTAFRGKNFLQFDAAAPDWLKTGVRIEAEGTLDLNLYNDVLGLGCRVSSLKEYVAPNP